MWEAFSNRENRKRTWVLLAVCGLLAAAAGGVGVSDNPPGIILAYLATTALVLAFVHPWRSAKRFGLLLLASVSGFVVCAVLHNLCHGIRAQLTAGSFLQGVGGVLGVVFFLVAILLCPPGLIVGVGGVVSMSIKNRSRDP
jgi:hypothetical protein